MPIPSKDRIFKGTHIDFESFGSNQYSTHPPPVLIGLLKEGVFKQVVFTQDYKWAAKDSGVGHDVEFFSDRNAFLLQMLKATSSVNRPLFAYSIHEQRVISKLLNQNIESRYRNVKRLAEIEINRRRSISPDEFPNIPKKIPKNLEGLAEALGIPMQDKLPINGITDRFRKVREYSSSRKAWEKAPREVQNAWKEVLMHNKEDVCILPQILLKLKR